MLIQISVIEDNMTQKLYLIFFFPGGYYFTIIWRNKDEYLVSSHPWDFVHPLFTQYMKTYLANREI